MSGVSKIILKEKLSRETEKALKSYLKDFLNGSHSIETSDGRMAIYLSDGDDVRMLRDHFPTLIASIHDPR